MAVVLLAAVAVVVVNKHKHILAKLQGKTRRRIQPNSSLSSLYIWQLGEIHFLPAAATQTQYTRVRGFPWVWVYVCVWVCMYVVCSVHYLRAVFRGVKIVLYTRV